jgi:hypothetical protein
MRPVKYLRKGNQYAGSIGYGKFGIPTADPISIRPLTTAQRRRLLGDLLMGYREVFISKVAAINKNYEDEIARIREDFEPVLGKYYLDHNEFEASLIDGIKADQLSALALNKTKYDILVSHADLKRKKATGEAWKERFYGFRGAFDLYPKRWWQSKKSYTGDVCERCGLQQKYGSKLCGDWDNRVTYVTEDGETVHMN